MHDRIDKVESTGADPNADNKYGLDKYDDQYYLDIGSEPPRFAYYRHVRANKWETTSHGQSEYDSTFTQDELDYALKREIRKTPEVRYQEEKANFLFHDLSCYMRDLGEEDYGCTGAGCIPECKYYPEYGVISDEEVIEKHNTFRSWVVKAGKDISFWIDMAHTRNFSNPVELPSIQIGDVADRQQEEALQKLEISEDWQHEYIKCQCCGNYIKIIGKMHKLINDRMAILEKRIKFLEDNPRASSDESIKQLEEELQFALLKKLREIGLGLFHYILLNVLAIDSFALHVGTKHIS
jgi:hypothetical protein